MRLAAGCVLLALVACDRPAPQSGSQVPAPAAAASDTVVRRVVRYRRDASAIQRVTGAGFAVRAEVPLDTVLAVRLLDVRGAEVPGATVTWTHATLAQGARLHVINEVTDSAGISAARFTPGRSAAPQLVVAEARGVGRIEFSLAVPVASVRLQVRDEIWSGETVVASAILEDANGVPLSDGRVTWAATDSAVLALQRSDSQRVSVTAQVAGAAELWGWSGGNRGRARVTVLPVLQATVAALGEPAPQARMRIETPTGRELEPADGVFRARIPWERGDELVLHVRPADSARYHPARIRVADPRHLQHFDIVLIPRRWRIREGSYAGQEISIDALTALSPVSGRAPFWRPAPVSGRGPKTILGWDPARLPIPIAFDRTRSTFPVERGDSVAFWEIARQMERDIGSPLFRPAATADDGVVRVEVRPHSAEGHTFVSWAQSGDVNDGTVRFHSAATLRNPSVVTHELLHLIGFGHSVAWPTVAVPADGREPRLTPHDVAYVQLAHALRRSGRRIGFPRLLP